MTGENSTGGAEAGKPEQEVPVVLRPPPHGTLKGQNTTQYTVDIDQE